MTNRAPISTNSSTQDQSLRPLPLWGWIVSILVFPAGLFIAYGYARLLAWGKSILYALLSYGCVAGFAKGMSILEHNDASETAKSIGILIGTVIFGLWGGFLYRIGKKAAFWTSKAQQYWRWAARFGVVIICVGVVNVIIQLLISVRRDH